MAQNGEVHNRAIQKSAPGPCTRGTCTAACAAKCPQPSCSHAACQTLVHMGSRRAACHQAPWKTPPSRCAATHRVNGASPRAHSKFYPNGRHADLAWDPNHFNKEARGYENAPKNKLGQECKHREGPPHPHPSPGHLGPTSSARWHGAPFASYKPKWNAGRPARHPVRYMAHKNHPKMFQQTTMSQPHKLSQHEQNHRPT